MQMSDEEVSYSLKQERGKKGAGQALPQPGPQTESAQAWRTNEGQEWASEEEAQALDRRCREQSMPFCIMDTVRMPAAQRAREGVGPDRNAFLPEIAVDPYARAIKEARERGNECFTEGRNEEAFKWSSRQSWLFYSRAVARLEQGEFEGALKDVTWIAKLDPDNRSKADKLRSQILRRMDVVYAYPSDRSLLEWIYDDLWSVQPCRTPGGFRSHLEILKQQNLNRSPNPNPRSVPVG